MSTAAETSPIIVCPSCGTPNRAPVGRALTEGKCGNCHQPLSSTAPYDIDEAMLERLVGRDTGAFVLDVWAPWCGPCRMMAPAYEAAAQRFGDRVRFFKMNSDQNQSAAANLNIRGIPTLIAWKDGNLVAQQPGAQTGDGLMRWIQSTFGLSN